MIRVLLYSLILIAGMVVSWTVEPPATRFAVESLTMVCLAYIMIEVGLEFTIDKKKLGSYGKDYLIALTTATFPWALCAAYFYWAMGAGGKESLLMGHLAAPTSAGVLFAMLGAAGLGTTWLFKKARILAIFDDLNTVVLMIPLQILMIGWEWQAIFLIPLVVILLAIAYFGLHRIRWPTAAPWLLIYGAILVGLTEWIYHSTSIHVKVLLSAFVWGCLLYHPKPERYAEAHLEPVQRSNRVLDHAVKLIFMFLVGASLPRFALGSITWGIIAFNVVVITFLSNIGKMFPSLCYRREASGRERLALGVALFPRGEVGAGILLITLNYGLAGPAVTTAALSLVLNLLLTGAFVWAVVGLTSRGQRLHP